MLKYECKDKLDRIYPFLIFLFLLIFVIFYHCMFLGREETMYLQGFLLVQKSALILFVGMLFISFEFFAEYQKKNWRELLIVYRGGLRKSMCGKFFLLLMMTAILFLVIFGIEMRFLAASGYRVLLLGNVIRVLLINDLLFPLTGVVLGMCLAVATKRRWSGYIWLLAIMLLGCGLLHRISMGLFMTVGWNLDSVYRMFQFGQPNQTWAADVLYGVPAENYRIFMFLAWIIGAVSVFFFSLARVSWKKILSAVLGVVLCVGCVGYVESQDAILNYDLNYGNATNKRTEFEADGEIREEAADFQVTKYEMDFSFEKELDAQVSMQVSGNERGNYTFTLYRGYEITQVTDAGGNALEYDRNQDFLTVYAPEEVEEIQMKYHGFSQTFYSSSDGVMLPGYFAYYPQPGKRSVFRDFLQERVQYYGFNTQEDTLQTAEFDITCEMNGAIYSNLPGEGHRFSGTTCAPTLMGGAAAKEKRTDGTYIYPALLDLSQVSLEPLKVEMRSICEKLGMDPSDYEQIDTLIVVPATVYMDDYWGQFSVVDHCLFIGSDQINEFDPKWTANDIIRLGMHIFGDKASLQFLLFDFVSNAKYVESLEPMSEEEFFAVSYDPADPDSEAYGQFYFGGQMEQMYVTLVKNFGEEQVVKETIPYLTGDSSQTSAEFMQQLYRRLEGKPHETNAR